MSQEPDDFDPFAGGPIARATPATEGQREIWLADQLSPETSLAYNEAVALRITGALDAAALRQALNALVARHESLHSHFSADGSQVLLGAPEPVALAYSDLRRLTDAARATAVATAYTEAVTTRFDLTAGARLRGHWLQTGEDTHELVLATHHLMADGWSWGVLIADLGRLYSAARGLGAAPAPATPHQAFADWQRSDEGAARHAADLQWWLHQFGGGSLPVLDLPTDHPRPPLRSYAARRLDVDWPADLVAALRTRARELGVSLFGLSFAGFAATLARLAGQDEVIVGVPMAGQLVADLPEAVGHAVYTLPVRTPIDSALPFNTYARQTSGTLLDALDHPHLTYGSLLRELPLARDASRAPLVGVLFNLDPVGVAGADTYAGLAVQAYTVPRAYEAFECFVNAVPLDGGLRIEVQYNTDLFDGATVGRWLAAWQQLMRSALAAGETPLAALGWVDADEMARLQALQPPPRSAAHALAHGGFAAWARQAPGRIAVRAGGTELTYAQLDVQSQALAAELQARGVQRGQRVGLVLPRNADMVVAVLACWRAGAAYVPLDPSYPAARLAYYAEDAALALILASPGSQSAVPMQWCKQAEERLLVLGPDDAWRSTPASVADTATGEDAAYVLYTSGSTGKPKGVEVPHRAVANMLEAMQDVVGLTPDDRLAAVTTLSFDIAVLELLLPLHTGGAVVVVGHETGMDGDALRMLIETEGVSVMQATPGRWRALLEAGWRGRAGFKALIGGESVPTDLALDLLERELTVWNVYGPTETTVWSTAWRIERTALLNGGMTIGTPIANNTVWVLGEAMQPCPQGVPGELWIGGLGLAHGYLHRPELTAERFVQSPFGAGRLYRTGDRGRWRGDGLIEHQGRLDFQIKVRGFRIELGEVEAACASYPGVGRVVAVAHEPTPGDVRLVAYLAAPAAVAAEEHALAAHLAARLPAYMVPHQIVWLETLPLLPNGKIDRKALPEPAERAHAGEFVAPRNASEAAIVEAMETVLSLPGVGATEDFFALGGHSLLAARLVSQLNRIFDLHLPLTTLFQAPTAEKLALVVAEARKAGASRLVIPSRPGRRDAPLTVMQQRVLFLHELHPERVTYNTPSVHRLEGPMDVALLRRALVLMTQRQPVLRTVISGGREARQTVLDHVEVQMPYIDLSAVPEGEREAELARRLQAEVDKPMDIFQAPLLRTALYKLSERDHALLFMTHHIIWDGWSFDLLYDEMAALYGALVEGHQPVITPLPVTYGDFAEWHQGWLQGEDAARQVAYWKQRFARVAPLRAPATDKPRGAGISGEGAAEWIHIEPELVDRLQQIAQGSGATLSMLMLAVYAAMLADAIGTDELVVGIPVRGRPTDELEHVMGFFNNLLPLPVHVERNQSMASLMAAVKAEQLAAMLHQDVPFERLAREPELSARSLDAGLYQSLFSYQDARLRNRHWGGLTQRNQLVFQKGATQDLGLWVMDLPRGMEGGIVYNVDIYTEQTARAVRDRYLTLLRRVAEDPNQSVATLVGGDDADALQVRRLGAAPAASRAPMHDPVAPVGEPLSEQEAALATIWAKLLHVDVSAIRRSHNFFDLGGDSLQAMNAIAAAEQVLGWRTDPRRYVFEGLAQLAQPPVAAPVPAPEPPPAETPGLLGRLFGRGRR